MMSASVFALTGTPEMESSGLTFAPSQVNFDGMRPFDSNVELVSVRFMETGLGASARRLKRKPSARRMMRAVIATYTHLMVRL